MGNVLVEKITVGPTKLVIIRADDGMYDIDLVMGSDTEPNTQFRLATRAKNVKLQGRAGKTNFDVETGHDGN